MNRRFAATVLAMGGALAACGDDDGTAPARDLGAETAPDAHEGGIDPTGDARADGSRPAMLDDDLTPDPEQVEGCQREPVAAGAVYAKLIECDEERVPGELAAGRVGDVVLRNARAAFVIRRADDSAALIGGPGGGIVDAAATGTEDVLKELLPVIGLSTFAPASASRMAIVASGRGGEAGERPYAVVRQVVEPRALEVLRSYLPTLRPPPVSAVVEYRLVADDPALRATIRVVSSRAVSVAPGLAMLLGGGGIGVAEGSLVLPELDAATASDATSLLVEGLGARTALGVSMGAASEVFRIDSLHLATAPSVSVAPSAITEVGFVVAVGASVAEARAASSDGETDSTFVATIEAAGPRTLIGIERDDGTAILWSRPNGAGRLQARLPIGRYRIRSALESRPHSPGESTVALDGTSGADRDETAPAMARGVIRVDATAAGAVAPVRVTIASSGVSPVDDEADRLVALGPTEIDVPAGRHRVIVSRGVEHDVHDVEIDVADGATVEVTTDLARTVDTTGWVACDFHLHTELSTDSAHPVLRALRMMAAEGLEVVASTDHDHLTDYPSLVNRAGVGDWLLAVTGDELSTSDYGHFGGYPLRFDPSRGANGAPVWFGLTPAEVFDALRSSGDGRDAIVQVNHPRLDRGFFGFIGLDPETGHATADPVAMGLPAETDLDDLAFDVVEVWNGYTRGDNEDAFADWLGLRAAGRRFTMVGNSDSHRAGLPPGMPRTFVRVPDDARGAFDWDDVEAGLRAGRTTVSGGIFVTIAGPGGEGPGEVLTATAIPGGPARVRVRVRVEAAPWIEVARLRLYRGREVVVDRAVAPSGDVVRLDEEIDVEVNADTFVVARADGDRDAEPVWRTPPFGVTGALDVTVP